jgi:hypothetical protein
MLEVSELTLKNAGRSSQEMFQLLDNYGYKIFFYTEDGNLTVRPPSYIYDPKRVSYDIVCYHKDKLTYKKAWQINNKP